MVATDESTDRLAEEARLGQLAFDRHVKAKLRPEDDGKFVAVDIDTGEYEIDADEYQATERLLSHRPGSRIWLFRAGFPTTHRVVRSRPNEVAR